MQSRQSKFLTHKTVSTMNKKFNGNIHIARKVVNGVNSEAARVARYDMKQEGITLFLKESQVFTEEELDELYSYDENEPWWNR